MQLQDKAVLITGASRGLGAALARKTARRGARVVLVARQAAALDVVVDQIRSVGGCAFALPADISRKDDVHTIAGAAAALAGNIDVLVHNASTLGPLPLRLLLDTDCEDLESVLQANLVGPFRLTKVIAGSMALRGQGLVVHISSDAAVSAYPRWGAYGVSKAAQDHLNRIFAAVALQRLGSNSSPSIRAKWTRRCMPTRCPRPTQRRSRAPTTSRQRSVQ